jgi:diaminopimelate decarboxylase
MRPGDLSDNTVRELAQQHGTPLWIYDATTIAQRVGDLRDFDTIRYAQKANSNLSILCLMKSLGVVVDAVSAGEIFRAVEAGFLSCTNSPGIIYTADVFDTDALALVAKYQIPVNVGSIDMISQLGEQGISVPIVLRINPGFGHGHSNKVNTGGPWSKHGIWHEQISECKKIATRLNIRIIGLHMHIGSGNDMEHLALVAKAMVRAARECGPGLEIISAGGGLPIDYYNKQALTGSESIVAAPAASNFDVNVFYRMWAEAKREIEAMNGQAVRLEVEPGRFLVAESGILVAHVCAIKHQGASRFILIDAGFNDLIRPAMYGAWHSISIVPHDDREIFEQDYFAVAGPLCESGDVFTQVEGGVVTPRLLPVPKVGDFVVIHDAGAYGASMSSNYNSRLLAPEVLVSGNSHRVIRLRQRFEDLIKNEPLTADLESFVMEVTKKAS